MFVREDKLKDADKMRLASVRLYHFGGGCIECEDHSVVEVWQSCRHSVLFRDEFGPEAG